MNIEQPERALRKESWKFEKSWDLEIVCRQGLLRFLGEGAFWKYVLFTRNLPITSTVTSFTAYKELIYLIFVFILPKPSVKKPFCFHICYKETEVKLSCLMGLSLTQQISSGDRPHNLSWGPFLYHPSCLADVLEITVMMLFIIIIIFNVTRFLLQAKKLGLVMSVLNEAL